jgi:hypothetical protein
MQNYRVVPVDDAGKMGRHRSFVCANDDDAIVWAKQMIDQAPLELWSGARFSLEALMISAGISPAQFSGDLCCSHLTGQVFQAGDIGIRPGAFPAAKAC